MTEHTTIDNSVDPAEVAKFEAMAEEWWNPGGKFAPLHKFNPVRLDYIRSEACAHFGLGDRSYAPLKGLTVLDVGCGGGLLSEPLARLGAQVTGIDLAEGNLKIAASHARAQNLDISYRRSSVEQIAQEKKQFDIVLNMEVVEHVADVGLFLQKSVACLSDNGLMFVASINRTAKAFALAIVGAEYLFNWLPRGTHIYEKLVRPDDIRRSLQHHCVDISAPVGMTYRPLSDRWLLSSDISVNYIVTIKKTA